MNLNFQEAERVFSAAAFPKTTSIDVGAIGIRRTWNDTSFPTEQTFPKYAEAFDVVVQLRRSEHSRLWKNGQLVHDGPKEVASLSVVDLRSDWRCEHQSPFDSVCFHIPFFGLRAFAERIGRRDFVSLITTPERTDHVMHGLAQALLPSLERPENAHPLFLNQMKQAILAHLTQRYGGLAFASRQAGTLATWQEKQVISHIVDHIDRPISISALAQSCGLSRSYFIKAFGRTFGRTPHRWLTEYRVRMAAELLQGDAPIAEIALACGFADQSHFTRVFSEQTGTSPARYRQPRGNA